MLYKKITEGIFLERMHRFGALVDIDNDVEYVHVKNTGRCRELLIPGVRVYLEDSCNPKRKTRFSLISVYKGEMLVNIDSQVPNQVVYDALGEGKIPGFQDVIKIRREVSYSRSRFDLYYERQNGSRGFIEVKGVTLDVNGTAMFPDAPTVRGARHLCELADAVEEGFESHVIFLIQYRPVKVFKPNTAMDPGFATALLKASEAGVKIHSYDSFVSKDGIRLMGSVPVDIT